MKNLKALTAGIAAVIITIPGVASAMTYTVKSGDTLSSIARKHSTTVSAIKSLNELKGDLIRVGQKLHIASEQTMQSEYRTVTNCTALNVRSGAGTSYKILTTINKGTKVEVVGSVSNGWYKIKTGKTTGYVNGDYLSSKTTSAPTTPTTPNAPNTSITATTYKVVAGDTLYSIAKAKGVTVANLKEWNKLTSDTIKVGQVLTVKKVNSNTSGSTGSSGTTGSGSGSSSTSQYATVTASKLNFRKSPNGTVLMEIAKGEKVEVLAVNGEWTQILYKGYNGWVATQYITIQGTTSGSNSNTSSSNLNYTVKPGDTLLSIATKHGLTVAELKKINHLETDLIYVGQMLAINPNSDMAKLVRPAEGLVSSEYGYRLSTGKIHNGIDVAKEGNVKVVAINDGVVTKSYTSETYGEVIFIKHEIDGKTYEAVYAHLRENSRMLKEGDTVKAGQQIAWMGNTGNSSGQHLHFEIHNGEWNYEKTNAINPRKIMNF